MQNREKIFVAGANEGTAFDGEVFVIHADENRDATTVAETHGAYDVDEVRWRVFLFEERGCKRSSARGVRWIQVDRDGRSRDPIREIAQVANRFVDVLDCLFARHVCVDDWLEHEVALQAKAVLGESFDEFVERLQAQAFAEHEVADVIVEDFYADRDFKRGERFAFFERTRQDFELDVVHIFRTRLEGEHAHVRKMFIALCDEVNECARGERLFIEYRSLVAHDHLLDVVCACKNVRFCEDAVRLIHDVAEVDVTQRGRGGKCAACASHPTTRLREEDDEEHEPFMRFLEEVRDRLFWITRVIKPVRLVCGM